MHTNPTIKNVNGHKHILLILFCGKCYEEILIGEKIDQIEGNSLRKHLTLNILKYS